MSRIFWSMLFAAMCLVSTAKAHPHVFVDARTGFIFNNDGYLEAVRISWTYDQFTTLILFESLDLDRDLDGRLSAADRAEIIAGETNWSAEYNGDVYLEVEGQERPMGRPKNATASLENDQITVAFDLPLSQPAGLAGRTAVLRLYDPFFYYAYTILADAEKRGLPPGCQADLISFEPDAAASALQEQLAALSREDTPDQPNVGRLFSDEVVLACG
ncbi:DUF1007 family protein [Roseobacter sp. MH60115]|uniref:DUF1007 family protein n=1 Tax=Roseobacter sp. MH60115 TaxID=2785324 RepID=UPI0018A27EBD|nr:DUF1007 family protein [Roseobacter sp. MH60115]